MAFTFFFRDMQSLELIGDVVIPELSGSRYLRIWDAGCAHGPEPYSIAMMIREHMSHFMFRNVKIDATDIDISNQFGEIIKKGVYPFAEIKRIPEEIRNKYFRETEKEGYFKLVDEIRNSVEFTRQNLLDYTPIRTGVGLIVCKNVLLHLQPEERVKVIEMFHGALNTGGFFMTEHTQKMPEECAHLFDQHSPGAQLHRKIDRPVAPQKKTTTTETGIVAGR